MKLSVLMTNLAASWVGRCKYVTYLYVLRKRLVRCSHSFRFLNHLRFRYRQVPGLESHDEWHLKCKTTLNGSKLRSAMIADLASGCMYRFGVRAIYAKGAPSIESRPSQPIMMEPSLPNGWMRMYDDENKFFYYANFRSKESQWTRPDLDEHFLDDSIRLMFSKKELNTLKELYGSLIVRFGNISTTTFKSFVLIKVGEWISESKLENLFANFTRRKGEASRHVELSKWHEFMSLIGYLKVQRVAAEAKSWRKKHLIRALYQWANKKKTKSLADAPRGKHTASRIPSIFRGAANLFGGTDYGHWVEQFDYSMQRNYYVEKGTEKERWDVPYEVRVYLPPKTGKTVSKVFDECDIETMRQYFGMLDKAQTGALNADDLIPIVAVLRFRTFSTPKGFLRKAVNAIDRNRSGLLDFEEFCMLMFFIVSRHKKGVWKKVDFNFDYSIVLGELLATPDLNSPAAKKKKRRRGWGSVVAADDEDAGSAFAGGLRPRSTTDALLSAIGLSVIASYKLWQKNMSKNSKYKEPTHSQRSESKSPRQRSGSSRASEYDSDEESELSYVKEFMLPGDEQKGLRHGGSCFCGCRQFDPLFVMQNL